MIDEKQKSTSKKKMFNQEDAVTWAKNFESNIMLLQEFAGVHGTVNLSIVYEDKKEHNALKILAGVGDDKRWLGGVQGIEDPTRPVEREGEEQERIIQLATKNFPFDELIWQTAQHAYESLFVSSLRTTKGILGAINNFEDIELDDESAYSFQMVVIRRVLRLLSEHQINLHESVLENADSGEIRKS